MTSRLWLAIVAVTVTSCARQAPLPVLVTPQTRLGLAEGYGPGIVSASARTMTFQLDAPAHSIVLRVIDDGTIEQVFPRGTGGSHAEPTGTYTLAATPAQPYAPDAPHVPSGQAYACPFSFDIEANLAPACFNVDPASAPPETRPVPTRAREREAGYWLVIMSDAATSAAALDARLRALDVEGGSLLDTVRQIPGALIGGHTTNWAAYYVGFAVLPNAARK